MVLLPLAMLALLPLTLWSSWVSPPITPYNYHRWVVMGALVVLWASVGWWKRHALQAALARAWARTYTIPGGRWLTLAAGLLVLAAVGLSPAPFIALLELAHWLGFAGLMLLVVVSVRRASPRLWQLVGGLAALTVLVYSLVALDHLELVWAFATARDLAPGLANVRHFSDIAAGLMPLALLYVVARDRPHWPAALVCLAPLAFWWWLLLLSEGRAGLLSLLSAMLLGLAVYRRAAAWPVGVLAAAALPALVAWRLFNPLAEVVVDEETGEEGTAVFRADMTSSRGRAELWTDALQHALAEFPLGIGPMQFAEEGRLSYASAHNLFLNTAAEWGLPLALLLLALVLLGSWRLLRRARALPEAEKPVHACLGMAFVGVMVNVQFAAAHIAPLSVWVLALVVGLAFGHRVSAGAPGAAFDGTPAARFSPSAGPAPALLWAAMLLVLGYLLSAGLSLYWLSLESTRHCFAELGSMHYFPRFWVQGRLDCMEAVAPAHWLFWHWRG